MVRAGGAHHRVPVAPRTLDRVHGGVGLPEGLPGTQRREQLEGGHAHRHRDPAVGLVGRYLVPNGQHELAGHGLGRPGVAVAEDDGELVPAHPGHQVAVAQVPAQGKGDLDYEPVPRLVAEGVVDRLEVVQVHDEQRPPRPLLGTGPGVPRQLQLEPAAVGQARQGVPGGQVSQRRLGTLVLSDVHHVDEDVLGPAARIAQHRGRQLAPAQPPPRAHQAHLSLGLPFRALGTGRSQHLQVVRVHQGAEAPAPQGPLRLAQEGAEGRVHGLQAPVQAHLGHAQGGRLECRPPAVGRPGPARRGKAGGG